MILKSIELQNFRNYKLESISFGDKTNIIYGQNAQGKTNILEACYVSGTSRSHKGSRDREMIRFGEEEAHIKATVQRSSSTQTIDIHLKKGRKKGIAINRVPVRRAVELFGILNIVFFSPEDLNIIKNGPNMRRRFMDAELCQLDKIYLSDLGRYNKIITQRASLLKDIYYNPGLSDTLEVWDRQLVEYGSRIINRRKKFIEELAPVILDIHSRISGGREELKISYEPNVSEEAFEEELFNALDRDKRMAQTSVGPHRDDVSFLVDGADIRKYGSQGQQRTCALSLKLSEIHIVEKMIRETPVLLLDDVLSELDSARQEYLLQSLSGTQTIITCTGMDEFVKNHFEADRVFEVTDGIVSDMKG